MRIAVRLLLALACSSLAACASAERKAEAKLVGKWRFSDGRQAAEYVFSKAGTFTGQVRSDAALISDFTGRWSLKGDTLLYEYTGDRLGGIPPGTLDRDQLLAMTKDHYVIQAADGSRRKYLRVAE